jgi:hypothetical protein
MAVATVEIIEPPPVQKQMSLHLVLTEAEAIALYAVILNIGGDPHKSWRQHIDTIFAAMSQAGLSGHARAVFESKNNSLYFRNDAVTDVQFKPRGG